MYPILRLKTDTPIPTSESSAHSTVTLPLQIQNDSDSVTELEDDEEGVSHLRLPVEMDLEEKKRIVADLYHQGYIQRAALIAKNHDIDLTECIQRTRVRSPNTYEPTARPVFRFSQGDAIPWLFTSDRVYLAPMGSSSGSDPGKHSTPTKSAKSALVEFKDLAASMDLGLTADNLALIPSGSPLVNRLLGHVDMESLTPSKRAISRTFYADSVVAPSQSDEVEFEPDTPKNKRRATNP
ncbi:hypothetical protein V5O48_008493 [Marasmius crinis-equi]|uniref:Uncharacterized protein n=1 Tax=Marasmius crinis-equi TaxID=585013 RepID=A0ABR3FDT8_9AGAR